MFRLISCHRHETEILVSSFEPPIKKGPICTVTVNSGPHAVTHRFYDIPTVYNLYRALGEALEEMCPGLVSPTPDAEAYAQQVRDEADADRIS